MHCPRCDVEVLMEKTRDGVTIDVCPACRGVWLDRGELERLIARAQEPFEDRRAEPRGGRAGGDHWGGRDDDRPGRRDRDLEDRRRRDDDDDDDDDAPRGGGFLSTLRNLFD